MPGDYDIEYTSPWAGANFCPLMTRQPAPGSNELGVGQDWEKATWPEWQRLASSVPEAGVEFERMFDLALRHLVLACLFDLCELLSSRS